jgi:hypothetical protein
VVWFGPGDGPSLPMVAVDFLKEKRPEKDWLNLPGQSSVFLLLRRAYWTRIWIVQEVLLAKSLVLLCGPALLQWDALRHAYELLKIAVRSESDRTSSLGMLLTTHTMKMVPLKLEWEALPYSKRLFSLRHLVESLYRLESTEPKDKIYGLLGIVGNDASHEELQFPVNYALPIECVYDQVLQFERLELQKEEERARKMSRDMFWGPSQAASTSR